MKKRGASDFELKQAYQAFTLIKKKRQEIKVYVGMKRVAEKSTEKKKDEKNGISPLLFNCKKEGQWSNYSQQEGFLFHKYLGFLLFKRTSQEKLGGNQFFYLLRCETSSVHTREERRSLSCAAQIEGRRCNVLLLGIGSSFLIIMN